MASVAYSILIEKNKKWTLNLIGCAIITRQTIEEFMACKSDKRFKYLFDGHVIQLRTIDHPLEIVETAIKAKVKPYQRPGWYNVCVAFNENSIRDAYCGCLAELSGNCHHIGAVLELYARYLSQNLIEVPSESFTDKLVCSWNKASDRAANIGIPITSLPITNNKMRVLSKEKVLRPIPSPYDPRPLKDRGVNKNSLKRLYNALKKSVPDCPFVKGFYDAETEFDYDHTEILVDINEKQLQNNSENDLQLNEPVNELLDENP